jgi:AcrR family transcriptional regulator
MSTNRRSRSHIDDRTARARIRDAAIERFAAEGIAAANLKDIAADAGVSAPLVIHHFGSKDGLRLACDEHIAALIREQKTAALSAGANLDPFQAIRAYEGTPIIRYLAQAIADGSPHVDEFIDEMVDDAVGYFAEGIESGVLTPAENLRERAIVLCLWQLGALVLHEQVERLLGVDLLDGTSGSALRWALVNADILAKGVINEEFYDKWRDAMKAAASEGRDASASGAPPTP